MGRRKVLRIASQFLPMLLNQGFHAYRVVSDSLPSDARVVNCMMNFNLHSFSLLIESESFPEVPEGESYPEICPTLTTGEDGNGFTFKPCHN